MENKEQIVNLQENFHVGTDQPIINFFLDIKNISRKLLPYEFNMNDMHKKELLDNYLTFTKVGWVYHFNSIPPNPMNRDANYWIERTYKELF